MSDNNPIDEPLDGGFIARKYLDGEVWYAVIVRPDGYFAGAAHCGSEAGADEVLAEWKQSVQAYVDSLPKETS